VRHIGLAALVVMTLAAFSVALAGGHQDGDKPDAGKEQLEETVREQNRDELEIRSEAREREREAEEAARRKAREEEQAAEARRYEEELEAKARQDARERARGTGSRRSR